MADQSPKPRQLYLVRHGQPQFAGGVKRCIGRYDLPLSESGIQQAIRLADYFAAHPVEMVFASPLTRARKTAQILAAGRYPLRTVEGLTELAMGEWENVPLKDLKKELHSEPQTGEGRKAGLERLWRTIAGLLGETRGDIVCVGHAGVCCAYLATLLGTPLETSRALRQPYGGISRLEVNADGSIRVCTIGEMPDDAPAVWECRQIWEQCNTPLWVRAHCEAVSEVALELGDALAKRGVPLNRELLQGAALLHDVARGAQNHPQEGGRILDHMGYPKVAAIIRVHHDLDPQTVSQTAAPSEAELVYLADKLVKGSSRVSLAERFWESREKCICSADPEAALEAHERRWQTAQSIMQKIQMWIKREGQEDDENSKNRGSRGSGLMS